MEKLLCMHKHCIWVDEFFLFSETGQDQSFCPKFNLMYLYVCSNLIYMYISIYSESYKGDLPVLF